MSLQPNHSCHDSQWTQVNLNASVDCTHMLSVYTCKQFTWPSTIQVNCSHPLPRHGNGTTVKTNNRSSVTPAPEFFTFSFLWNSFTRRMAIYTHASRTRVHRVTSTEGNCQDRRGARDCRKTGERRRERHRWSCRRCLRPRQRARAVRRECEGSRWWPGLVESACFSRQK